MHENAFRGFLQRLPFGPGRVGSGSVWVRFPGLVLARA